MYIELVISVRNLFTSLFDFVDGDNKAIGDECVLFLNDCFVNFFTCDSLNSIGNELDSWVIVWV